MTNPIVLFRDSDGTLEIEHARHDFRVEQFRSKIPQDSLVIGRYSVLPFYRELEQDLLNNGSSLINSHRQHQWIANFDWYEWLKDFTPESCYERDFYRWKYEGPFVLKGATNSRKHQWKTHMYAETRRDASRVAGRLANDSLIGQQGIVYRRYVPLKRIETCEISGLPLVNEWRLFYYKETLLSKGFYWTNCQYPERATFTSEALELASKCAEICAEHTNFFVLDVAETESGEWILVEVNDGQMSGLSDNNPMTLYRNLRMAIGE